MFRSLLKCSAVALLLSVSSPSSQAGLLGDTVQSKTFTLFAGDNWSTGNSAVVGAGVEFTRVVHPQVTMELDVRDDGFVLRYTNNIPSDMNNPSGSFNLGWLGFELTDLNWAGGTITGVKQEFAVFPDVLNPVVTPTSVSFSFNAGDVIIPGDGTVWSADYTFITQPDNPSQVPEPSTITGVLVGLAVVGFRKWRQ